MARSLSLLLFLISAVVAAGAAEQGVQYRTPRTDSGHPDLEGVWNFNSGVPLQRPPALAAKRLFSKDEFETRRASIRNAVAMIRQAVPVEAAGLLWFDDALHVEDLRTSLITYPENGRLPPMVAGVRREPGLDDLLAILSNAKGGPPPALLSLAATLGAAKKDSYKDFNLSERCLLAATVPFVPQLGDNYMQIIQGQDHVALVMDFDRRVISLDARPPLTDTLRSWSGASRGHWEGDTLVVETGNFTNRMPSLAAAGNSRDKVVTERFTRRSADVIDYAATVVDPTTFTDRIELSFPMARVDSRIYEAACHEGNYSLANSLTVAPKDEQPEKSQ